MLITTTDSVPGREIVEALGLVTANTVRARHLGRDVMAGLKNLVGGEIQSYRQLLSDARAEALSGLEKEAAKLGADAVVEVRLATATIAAGAAEIVAYGTAVKLGGKA
ncbi:MAG: YbjQ family protein [Gaiellaceae bacterium]